jgi:hypothetical protein
VTAILQRIAREHGRDGKLAKEALSRQNEYSRFSALNPAERGGNSRAKTVGLQPAMVREQAV